MPGPDRKAGGRPYGRGECPTNGAPDVAGLHSVLGKLIALAAVDGGGGGGGGVLPPSYTASLAAWKASLGQLPPLATEECHYGGHNDDPHHSKITGCRTCAPNHNATSCWCNGHMPCDPPTATETVVAVAGQYAGIRQHNHENHAAYAIWPFRQYAVGKPQLAIGQATYAHRPHPCNHNWCQDVADAAMLNLSTDAAAQVLARANAPPLSSSDGPARFRGFSQHYEDYSPAADHLSMMRIALHEMLLGKLDDANRTITLFPSWPAQLWDVSFKLQGAGNTTVEASCVGGQLKRLVVTPPERRANVVIFNCPE